MTSHDVMQKNYVKRGVDFRKNHPEYFPNIPEGESGDWKVKKFRIPNELDIHSFRAMQEGRGWYPGEYLKLACKGRGTVMSNTPAEVRDLGWLTGLTPTRAIINGLGLGIALNMLLVKNPLIEHIDIIEIDPDVIKLVGPYFEKYAQVHIHQGDAYTFKWPKGTKWDIAWHDIWDTISTDNLPLMTKLHRKYGRRVETQYSWCHFECKRLQGTCY